jgi:hypothetical protein
MIALLEENCLKKNILENRSEKSIAQSANYARYTIRENIHGGFII